MAYSIGVSKVMLPLYMVDSQLNILTPEGMATRKVRAEKTTLARSLSPATNRWWPQTMKLSSASETLE